MLGAKVLHGLFHSQVARHELQPLQVVLKKKSRLKKPSPQIYADDSDEK
jgi:hypothetical protein